MYTGLSDIDQNRTKILFELSLDRASTLTISIVYLFILMIVGIVGNIVVLIIFFLRFGPSTHRYFILTLAVFDLFACSIGAPFTIVQSFLTFNYFDEISCKLLSFVLCYTNIASSFTLTLIAVERSRKICTPLKTQFTVSLAKKAVVIVAGASAFLSASPTLVIYGNVTIPTGYRNVTGTMCFIKDSFKDTILPIGYNVFLLLLAFLCTAIMSVCYVRIAKTVSKMGIANIAKRMKTVNNKEMNSKSDDSSVTNADVTRDEVESDTPSKTTVGGASTVYSQSSSNKTNGTWSLNNNPNSLTLKMRVKSALCANKVISRLTSTSGRKTIRITKMLTFVTVAFVLSYLPHLILMIWSLSTPDEDNLPKDNAYQFIFYSFLVNNLLNPFIYAAMDLKFRNELKKLLRCKITVR